MYTLVEFIWHFTFHVWTVWINILGVNISVGGSYDLCGSAHALWHSLFNTVINFCSSIVGTDHILTALNVL